jgi:hypothetical protein
MILDAPDNLLLPKPVRGLAFFSVTRFQTPPTSDHY